MPCVVRDCRSQSRVTFVLRSPAGDCKRAEIAKQSPHLSCESPAGDCKRARFASRVTFVLRSPAGRLQARGDRKAESHFVLRSPAGDCKRTEIAKQSHICLAISGRRLQAHGDRKAKQRRRRRGGGNSSSSKEATSQAVSARPSLTQSIDPNRIPDEPWLEIIGKLIPKPTRICAVCIVIILHRIHGGVIMKDQTKKVLIDLAICQLNSFVAIDALLIGSCFWCCETAMFSWRRRSSGIVSDGEDRVSVGQLIQMHCFRMQRAMSCHLINLISECDRSGSGLLDVYDFRLLIAKLAADGAARVHAGPAPMEREREKMDEALLERATAVLVLGHRDVLHLICCRRRFAMVVPGHATFSSCSVHPLLLVARSGIRRLTRGVCGTAVYICGRRLKTKI
uniref:EF-hand domain-containing protein n=1 Tax=Macrostomum lignano TaxID=282301 RepID=A0A1I8FGS1_9PLAT